MSNIVIYGMGKTGKALCGMLGSDDKLLLYDDDPDKSAVTYRQLKELNIDLLLVSPGVRPDAPVMRLCREKGIEPVSELQYCFDRTKARCVSVTGTNGKTTVTELIYAMLNKGGVKCSLLGNGGVPFASTAAKLDASDTAILETSSFQLTYSPHFDPYISLITNLAPDHIDYHGSFEEYVKAKCNNFLNQSPEHYALFNAADEVSVYVSRLCACRKVYFGNGKHSECRIEGDYVVTGGVLGDGRFLAEGLTQGAAHNVENFLAAFCVSRLLNVSGADCIAAANDFIVPKHRAEVIAQFDDVTFTDDSKATNVHAAAAALSSVCGIKAAIFGGSYKGTPFDDLFGKECAPDFAALIGDTAKEIAECAEKHGYKNYAEFANLAEAVKACFEFVKNQGGGTVILTPACASFDMFKNFEQRGDEFCRIVRELER